MTVAALFVVTDGVYFGLPGVSAWDEIRDARRYPGPHPVVAHPPCERWGRYWSGGPSAKTRRTLGDDGGCFAAALRAVRTHGGVLEHPEGSHAFKAFGLGRPGWRYGWIPSADCLGFICCVAQGHYGHRARKLTWLYAVPRAGGDPNLADRWLAERLEGRSPVDPRLPELNWSIPEPAARLDYGFHSAEERRQRHHEVSPTLNRSRLSTRENLATPIRFRDVLLGIARSVS